MPRPLRLEYQDAWYHVMNRGTGRRRIFKTDTERQQFLTILGQAMKQFHAKLHGYCLMDNHYHLLINTPQANISRVMRHINGVYTQIKNRQDKTDGSLFRGRYKAIVISGDSYLLQVSRYIHLNPITAKIVNKAEKYAWSSYRHYLGVENEYPWLTTQTVLSMLVQRNKATAYREFVEAGLDAETRDFYAQGKLPIIFASQDTKVQLLKKIDKEKMTNSKADYKRLKDLPSLEKVLATCVDYFKVKEDILLCARRGKVNEARKIAIYFSRMLAGEKLATIAKKFHCYNHSSISNTVKSIEIQIKSDKQLARVISEVGNKLNR
jgi:REP element-mobilizing transposase RayT